MNELTAVNESQSRGMIQNPEQLYQIADSMMKSGLFKDIRDANQAVVKILAGQEYGIGPFAAMKSIYIIQGNATLAAGLMASKVKAHPKYDYRIKQLDNDGCIVTFYENINGEMTALGDSSFDKSDAQTAGLSGKDNWNKYPRNMYFSRAISNGVRFYCPDVFHGLSVYTPEEIDPDWIVDAEIVTIDEKSQEKTPVKKNSGEIARPFAPEKLKELITQKAKVHDGKTMNDAQNSLMVGMLELCFAGDGDASMKRHTLCKYLTDNASTKKIPDNYKLALLDWLKPVKDDGGAYTPDPMAQKEAQAVLTQAHLDNGQQELI